MGRNEDAIDYTYKLVGLALHGRLKLREFHKLKMVAAETSALAEFLKRVQSDIEAAIEHTPGRWLTGGIAQKAWRRQVEYHQIELDRLLLEYLRSGGTVQLAEVAHVSGSASLRDGESDLSYIEELMPSGIPRP